MGLPRRYAPRNDIFAPGVVQICDDFCVLVSFLHQGWCNILAKVVQILTLNNNME